MTGVERPFVLEDGAVVLEVRARERLRDVVLLEDELAPLGDVALLDERVRRDEQRGEHERDASAGS